MVLSGATLFAANTDTTDFSDSDFILEIFEGKSIFNFWINFKSTLASSITAKSRITKTVTMNSFLYKRTT